MSHSNCIEIKNARVNNLKGVSISLPRNKFIVVTGVSGSGKSSLAFDTLYAEGQRRYVESLNSYARQFLGRNNKPEVDYIKGIPPAIAIEQKVNTRNPRSTVGTSTEIYDYLKLLFARVGRTYSPISGNEVRRDTVTSVTDYITGQPIGTKVVLLTPAARNANAEYLKSLMLQGFTRVEVDGELQRLSDETIAQIATAKNVNLVIDRLTANAESDTMTRLADSISTAFYEGHGECIVRVYTDETYTDRHFSDRFEADGMTFTEPSEQLFTFNSPVGACAKCEGFGKIIAIAEHLVVPDQSRSVAEDCVACWIGPKLGEWKKHFMYTASACGFDVYKPYRDLTDRERDLLWHGNKTVRGIDDFFAFVEEQQYKIQYRVIRSRFRGRTVCPECHGSRLKREASYVKVNGRSITELVNMPIDELSRWFDEMPMEGFDRKVSERLLTEIRTRLHFLCDVGLEYLTLNRPSNTLSGGESQRINLSTSLGSSLVGSLYVLDEPSIGLHSRDTERLISVLHRLRDLGNTVVVVEHDEEIIRAADRIVDIGPEAGRLGGEVVFEGNFDELRASTRSLTTKYLTGELSIPVPSSRRAWNRRLTLSNVNRNNLRDVSVDIPLNVLTVVTGVSGSGKSTLITQVLFPTMARQTGQAVDDEMTLFGTLTGDVRDISKVEFIDQNPIGRSTRSNPATYLHAYDEIRKLMAAQPLAKHNGYTAAHFSFNTPGGRCEACQGEGYVHIEMQFMADVVLQCEHCHGRRFKDDILEVRYKGQNVSDILDMTVNQAIEFFGSADGRIEKAIVARLKPLQDVGIGYIKLGQSSSTLSGGETQRVKLASFIADESTEPTLFIFDEPTTGLHFHDIRKLLSAFDRLIANGHTLVVIEHNMEVIKNADYIIDLGPEGGAAGGNVVAVGTPEDVAQCEASHTGRYLKHYLH